MEINEVNLGPGRKSFHEFWSETKFRSPVCLIKYLINIFSLRYMRSEDRNIHANNYPALHYPELYLLEGGYKALFEYSTVNLSLVISFFETIVYF